MPVAATGATDSADAPVDLKPSGATGVAGSYIEYFGQNYKVENIAKQPFDVTADSASATENGAAEKWTDNGVSGIVLDDTNGWVEWQVDVPAAGLYNLTPTYYPLPKSGRAISLKFMIDGVSPFVEAQTLSLPRIWKDAAAPAKDETGNDIRPKQIEIPAWTSHAFTNELGMYADPYYFNLSAGTHTIRVELVREAVAINKLTFSNVVNAKSELPSYKEYKDSFAGKTSYSGSGVIKQEAESPDKKSDSTLYALTDHQDAGTTPTHPTNMLMNTIGGTNWSTTGQYITWKVDVEKEGWYTFAMRARQNLNQGMISYRTLSVNGEIPFAEAVNLPFVYDSDWEVQVLGGKENPLQLWLKPGDEVTLTVSSGELCDVLRTVQQSVLELNEIYRKIIVITGTSPDIYQDYYLEDEIDSLQPMTSLFEQTLLLLGDIVAKMIIDRQELDMKGLWQYHANLE